MPLQIIMNVSNKFPHNITITSSNDTFYFEPIMTDELGLCYSFNSRISSFLSPEYSTLLAFFASRNFLINFFPSFPMFLFLQKLSCFSEREESVEVEAVGGNQLFWWGCKCRHRWPNKQCRRKNYLSYFRRFFSSSPFLSFCSTSFSAQTSNFSCLSRTIVIHLLTYKQNKSPVHLIACHHAHEQCLALRSAIDTFQIYYHGPNEIPSQLRRIVNEDPEQGSYISLSLIPVMIKSQERTRALFEFQRKCRFEEESTLVNFPQIYTQDLCRLDCRMAKFLDVCKCLPFFYKRKGTQGRLAFNDKSSNDIPFMSPSSNTWQRPINIATERDWSALSTTEVSKRSHLCNICADFEALQQSFLHRDLLTARVQKTATTWNIPFRLRTRCSGSTTRASRGRWCRRKSSISVN